MKISKEKLLADASSIFKLKEPSLHYVGELGGDGEYVEHGSTVRIVDGCNTNISIIISVAEYPITTLRVARNHRKGRIEATSNGYDYATIETDFTQRSTYHIEELETMERYIKFLKKNAKRAARLHYRIFHEFM